MEETKTQHSDKHTQTNLKSELQPTKAKQYSSKTLEQTVLPYFEQHLQTVLDAGLKEIMQKLPDDPISYLGHYLLQHADNSE